MKNIAFLLLIFVSAAATSCKKHDFKPGGVFKGPEVKLYNGKAYTLFKTDGMGNPEKISIVIDDNAMNSLPAGKEHMDESNEDHIILQFHPRAMVTPFDHVLLDYNPHGHEPEGVYTVPHFDFHFYMTSVAAQMDIPPYEVDSTKFVQYPSADYMPQNYFAIPGGVPMMGSHWVDATSPELHGQQFTQTFLFGSYAGKVTFYEPMITTAFLTNNLPFQRAIPVPAKFKKSGYYPTKLHLVKHNGFTEIILEAFVYRQQS